MIVLFLYFLKSNFEVVRSARLFEGTGGKIGINVEKWSFCQDLGRKFSRLSLTHQNTLSYTFSDQIHPPPPSKVKNCIFGQLSNSSLIFYPLPILGLSFKFYYAPYPVTVLKLDEAKFHFQNLRLSKVIQEKPKGGRLLFDIRRVKKH